MAYEHLADVIMARTPSSYLLHHLQCTDSSSYYPRWHILDHNIVKEHLSSQLNTNFGLKVCLKNCSAAFTLCHLEKVSFGNYYEGH